MEQKSIPKFYGLRIYLSSILLYFFLVFPFIGFIIFQNVPDFIENRAGGTRQVAENADSLRSAMDSIPGFSEGDIDSMVNKTIQGDIDILVDKAVQQEKSRGNTSSLAAEEDILIGPHPDEQKGLSMFSEKGPFSRYFFLLFILLGVSLLSGLLYNSPFKRFFKKRQRKKEIPQKLLALCKKRLFRLPLVNSLIVTMPNIVVIIYSLIFLVSEVTLDKEVERSMFIQLHYLTIVATLLEFLFVYYWQKHRVHIKYIDHIYSGKELRKQIFRKKGGKIRNRLMVASGMTTFLPLVVVMVYLVLSITTLKELELDHYTDDHREILFGPWSDIMGIGKDSPSAEGNKKFFYVNAIDSIMMLVGIGNGILVSFIYLLLFIRWTNRDISWPLKELLIHIRNTRGGDLEQFTIVRTNDELGELAEGYNEMTEKIHNHVESISAMNRDLEKKVKERTQEVVEQKEEIETQKEEIEAQLNQATLQRDTISKQKELILDSIHYAKRIQSAILPPVHLLKQHLSDSFILFKPRDIVSGDYYWAREKDHKLLIAVADCTGHGVPGGFLSMLGIASMNEIVNRSVDLNPGKILEELREVVIASMHQTGSRDEARDGIEIALCVIDLKLNSMVYSGANRPLYLIRDGALEHFRPDRMPIGIYDQEPDPFTSNTIRLRKGDSLYLFSDGYVDQLGGPLRKTFRAVNFRKLLLRIQDQPMEKQKAILAEKMALWQGSVEQIDDIVVMGIKI
ncbi:MAG: SpoIIE family protein phosphatase [Bacteroidales bacterium]|nr:SpoIIE family protein phosphatase [Bacteroidales bacterium]